VIVASENIQVRKHLADIRVSSQADTPRPRFGFDGSGAPSCTGALVGTGMIDNPGCIATSMLDVGVAGTTPLALLVTAR